MSCLRVHARRGFLASVLSGAPAACAFAQAAGAGLEPLALATGEWPPFMSEQLPNGGFVTEIVRQALAEVGATPRLSYYPWARAMAQVQSGPELGSLAWYRNPERERLFHFSEAVFMERQLLFFRRRQPLPWTRLADLQGRRIGLTTGYFYGEDLMQAERERLFTIDRAPSDERSLRKLLLGRVDAAVVSHEVGRYLLATRFTEAEAIQIGWHARPINEGPLCLIFARQPAGLAWRDRFDRGLLALRRSGRVEAIVRAAGLG